MSKTKTDENKINQKDKTQNQAEREVYTCIKKEMRQLSTSSSKDGIHNDVKK